VTLSCITTPQPLATLAGLGVVTVLVLPDPAPEGLVGQRVGIYADEKSAYRVLIHEDDPERRLWSSGSQVLTMPKFGNEDVWAHGNPFLPLPMGAVVASATLQAVLPVLAYDDELPTAWMPHIAPTYDGHWVVWHGPTDTEVPSTGRPSWRRTDLSDQLPYLSDIRPGMWCWILSDPAPTTTRCPACWGEGTVNDERPALLRPTSDTWRRGFGRIICPRCFERGSCEPIRVAGGPGVWRWTP
jgi:hypothetical protein